MRRLALLVILSLSLAACSSLGLDKKFVPKPTAFLEHGSELAPVSPDFALDQFWANPDGGLSELLKTYDQIYIKPINFDYLQANPDEQRLEISAADRKEIGDYFSSKLNESFTNSKLEKKFKVVSAPGLNTFTLEVAISQLVPTAARVKAVKEILNFLIPGSFLVSSAISMSSDAAIDSYTRGSISIEVKLSNAANAQVLAEGLDRREDRSAILFNAKDFSRFGNTKSNIDEWATELVELIASDLDKAVKRNDGIALILW